MICSGLAPMLCAASITPWSISSSEDSMTRAMNGAAEIVSGTIAAVVPMEEPTSTRVSGMMATIKIINGVERVALTITPSTELTAAFGRMWLARVTVKIIPSGMPMRLASSVEATTI